MDPIEGETVMPYRDDKQRCDAHIRSAAEEIQFLAQEEKRLLLKYLAAKRKRERRLPVLLKRMEAWRARKTEDRRPDGGRGPNWKAATPKPPKGPKLRSMLQWEPGQDPCEATGR
jgi:hypothetical protein